MNVLVTAGNTLVPIDQVRCITNIFTGRTGAAIALRGCDRGHTVTLLTSHPEVVADLREDASRPERFFVQRYRTFDDLERAMSALIQSGNLDAVIHCAAVSDYQCSGVHALAETTRFDPASAQWSAEAGQAPSLVDRAAGKVKSDEPELWLRLTRSPKLIDKVRTEWGFRGVLVKFKLEVGVSEERLLEIAEASRKQSAADFMVANTLEGASEWALLGPLGGAYRKVGRRELSDGLLDAVEGRYRELTHG